ncbi:MAG: hypothetical protein ACD_10C00764G0005 [uncultured bacterium]|nr:MAG: hypothetical protein ACD_10C00764G0005 [uncultured bacterium]
MFRHRRLDEINDQIASLLPDIDAGSCIAEIDDNPSFTVFAAAEHHVTQRMLAAYGAFLDKAGATFSHRIAYARNGRERHVEGFTIEACCVVHVSPQIKDESSPLTHLDDVHAAQIALIDQLTVFSQSICGRREIEGDFCRAGNTKTSRRRAERLLQVNLDRDIIALPDNVDCLDGVGRERLGPQWRN